MRHVSGVFAFSMDINTLWAELVAFPRIRSQTPISAGRNMHAMGHLYAIFFRNVYFVLLLDKLIQLITR